MRMRPFGRSGDEAGARRLKLAVVLLTGAAIGYLFIDDAKNATVSANAIFPPVSAAQEFAKFQHGSAQHARMPCLLCHKREANLFAPKLPGHLPCAGCHVQQFADQKSQICLICHTSGAGLKRFPRLQSFNATFDHRGHQSLTTCASCHQSNRRGVGYSVPAGATAHRTCFQCHGPRTEIGGRNIGSCGTCHQPGTPVRASDWAQAFRVNFSHQEHLRKANVSCASCHTVRPGIARGRQVTAPVALMHSTRPQVSSCASCHNNTRAFGTANFTDCKRCHEGTTFKF